MFVARGAASGADGTLDGVTPDPNLQAELQRTLDSCRIPARAVLLPTGWPVGPVTVYLFPDDPVTLIDAGRDTPASRSALEAAFAAAGRALADLSRLVVTHADSDHVGAAAWLRSVSGCEVFLHEADVPRLSAATRAASALAMLGALGFSTADLEALFADGPGPDLSVAVTPLTDGAFLAGRASLRAEHRPGHTPGHVWLVDEASGAVFVGDHLLAGSPTSAGLDADPMDPAARLPMLVHYERGLRELAARPAPVLLPGHGPPIAGHAALIERRLAKSARRTRHVARVLASTDGDMTAVDVVRCIVGQRLELNPWGILSDIVGRLDLLVVEGRADAVRGDDGIWRFRAGRSGPRSEEEKAHG